VKKYEGPIEVGMVFTCPDNSGELGFRRVRVLAAHPDGGWILEDLPGRMKRENYGPFRSPELNLRIVFQPEGEA
jgi:hypothetical protein